MSNFAGRVFVFSERCERSVVDRMRDIDEMLVAIKALYPENTWTRADFLMLFFLDDMGDAMQKLASREADE